MLTIDIHGTSKDDEINAWENDGVVGIKGMDRNGNKVTLFLSYEQQKQIENVLKQATEDIK